MTIISTAESISETTSVGAVPEKKKPRRRGTGRLKKVPAERTMREQIRDKAAEVAAKLDKSMPLGKDDMERVSRALLEDIRAPETYLGWTMVAMASEFWRDQVASVPRSRRLLLLPHCLKPPEDCPAEYDEFGMDCGTCRECNVGNISSVAENMGYRVLVAEGSPIVMKIIVSGYVDAIMGVACLNVLERALDRILLAGIPCMAIPLLTSDCHHTKVDEDWVQEMVQLEQGYSTQKTCTYIHLMRAASQMFEPDNLEALVPRVRSSIRLDDKNSDLASQGIDPVAGTEAIAYDFLSKGGKHSRPFITLAVHDALTGGHATQPGGAETTGALSDSIRRVAMSIETFHKASLVHDDVQDDDRYRYGDQTIHRQYGVPTAINVGDYLIGMGYRLVSREADGLGAETSMDILNGLAEAHIRLSEGQGAELLWRDSQDKRLKPVEALRIYALKTAPAFEAALLAGVRLAGLTEEYAEPIRKFARFLGVGFQIVNDLDDWLGDRHNKMVSGSDAIGGRPTVLWALALEGLPEAEQDQLIQLIHAEDQPEQELVRQIHQFYEQADVFEKAHQLIDIQQQRAEEIADSLEPEPLRRLLHYLIDAVLLRPSAECPPEDIPRLFTLEF